MNPAKIYGARVAWTYKGETKSRINWYSHDEQEALVIMEKAKAIPAPENVAVTFEPVSDGATVLSAGVYKTEAGRRVEIYHVGPLSVRGCFLKPNGKPQVGQHCMFWANGDPQTHKSVGRIVGASS